MCVFISLQTETYGIGFSTAHIDAYVHANNM